MAYNHPFPSTRKDLFSFHILIIQSIHFSCDCFSLPNPLNTASSLSLSFSSQLLDFNEAPLFLQLTPTISSFNSAQSSGELPISLYESVVELAPSTEASKSQPTSSDAKEGMEATMFFVPAPYHIETGEAERIAVDHTSKPPEDGDGESSASEFQRIGRGKRLRCHFCPLRSPLLWIQILISTTLFLISRFTLFIQC